MLSATKGYYSDAFGQLICVTIFLYFVAGHPNNVEAAKFNLVKVME